MSEQNVLAKWLETYSKPNTKRLYGAALKHFLSHIYGGTLSKTESLAIKFISEYEGGGTAVGRGVIVGGGGVSPTIVKGKGKHVLGYT